jgi:hypothetical protein
MAIDKSHIICEIKRITIANRGKPPGVQIFERETGIKQSDWYPDTWLRWSGALEEAGYLPNKLQGRMGDEVVIEKYIALVRELNRFPVIGEIRRKGKIDKSFPSHSRFERFGGKERLIEKVVAYCESNPGFEDVLALYSQRPNVYKSDAEGDRDRERKIATGFVYLMKSGRHYKIGRTNSLGRRGSELAIKIPVAPKTIHSIETDDPVGRRGLLAQTLQ